MGGSQVDRISLESFLVKAVQEAKILIEHWQRVYNQVKPHSALEYKPSPPKAVLLPTITATLRTGLPQTLRTYPKIRKLRLPQKTGSTQFSDRY